MPSENKTPSRGSVQIARHLVILRERRSGLELEYMSTYHITPAAFVGLPHLF